MAQTPNHQQSDGAGDRDEARSNHRSGRRPREKMQIERGVVKRKKRAECRAKAKAEKVALMKRPAYVKNCVAQSN